MRPNRINNKGSGMITFAIVIFILMSVFLMIGVFFGGSIINIIFGSQDKQICKQSVQRNAELHLLGLDFASEVKCPTQDVEIKVDKDLKNEPEVRKELADYMVDCWDNFGEGKLELFDTSRATEKSFCAICQRIEFSRSGEEIKNFTTFLATEPRPPPNHNQLYYEYLTPYDSDDTTKKNAAKKDKETDYSIYTSLTYATVFIYGKDVGFWDKISQAYVVGGAAVVTVGLILWALPPVGATFTVTMALAAGALGFAAGYGTGDELDVDWTSAIVLVPYTSEVLDTLGCDIAPTDQMRGQIPNEE